jgi:hypothetical protein
VLLSRLGLVAASPFFLFHLQNKKPLSAHTDNGRLEKIRAYAYDIIKLCSSYDYPKRFVVI